MGFGEQGVGRKLFGHERERDVISKLVKRTTQSFIVCCLH